MLPLQEFDRKVLSLVSHGLRVQRLADFVYRLDPRHRSTKSPASKSIDLTLMALTHGNEVGGFSVLSDLVDYLALRPETLSLSLVLALGSPEAAVKGQRYVQSDLNRSFSSGKSDTIERRRALQLEPILAQTRYLVDLHQTKEPCPWPFFIFPYKATSLQWAAALHPRIPIVTHWGGGFSGDGCCTDEFVNAQGGLGISIELGQNGSDVFKVAAGVQVCLQALALAEHSQRIHASSARNQDIYTWAGIVPWAPGTLLDPGWQNFSPIRAGERIGTNSDGETMICPHNGWLLFPKYPKEGESPTQELVRILKRISLDECGR